MTKDPAGMVVVWKAFARVVSVGPMPYSSSLTNAEERQELARGLSFSSKADMYSFGCLLYELIHLECETCRLTRKSFLRSPPFLTSDCHRRLASARPVARC